MGRGLTSAAGSPSLRAVLELSYVPAAPEIAPIHVAATVAPDRDSDGDGIVDSHDKCPREPEDKDGFADWDGCPDLDNDQDGIPDALDKCPLEPEDKDGFADSDGCPDKDNDEDGIDDVRDKCPDVPEDKDGHDDIDGCPDLDDDHDGIPDADDKCPQAPETINGIDDNDGCPDRGDSAVMLSPDRIDLLGSITFERRNPTKLDKSSFNLLGQVAATMRAHPDILRVRVTCYVNPTGDYDKDQTLSDQRAQAVRAWLVQWGIDGKRVEARGFGGRKPLAPPGQRGAAKINNRIEMVIMDRK
jgi:outer membrane protein OmpA-like peptidoglycan-associated protein